MIRRNLLCRANWQLATEIANCFQMPDEPMETFLNKINEICARMVTDPGEDMILIKGEKGKEEEERSEEKGEASSETG